MPRTSLQKTYANFKNGFISTANPLQYPEGSLKDIVNFNIKEDGTLYRRSGLEFTTLSTQLDVGSLHAGDFNNIAINIFKWENAGNVGNKKIAVIQVGATLYFYDISTQGIDMSSQVSTAIDLGFSSTYWDIPISYSNGSGKFFIAHPQIKPCYLEYSASSGNITKTDITLQIRDLNIWEGKAITVGGTNYTADQVTGKTKGSTLFPQHEYNLRNGGWPITAVVADNTSVSSVTTGVDPVLDTDSKMGFYPPISVSFWYGKAGQGTSVDAQNSYSPWALENDFTGTSAIPVGRNVVNAEDWTRLGDGQNQLVDGHPESIALSKEYKWSQFPSAVAFYSGRVWYAGVQGYDEIQTIVNTAYYYKADNLDVSNTLYYSQVINDNDSNINKCYQEADPTAEDINQLVATDGGTISIREIGQIYSLGVYGTSLIVFSDQGVWAVTGKDANSFEATSYSVIKISSKAPVSKTSISALDNQIFYLADDAIYVISQDKVTGSPIVQDVSSSKIKGFYTNLPTTAKETARLIYDKKNRTFYILYIDPDQGAIPPLSIANKFYNKCLVLNEDLGAYYKYELGVNPTFILDGIYVKQNSTILDFNNVQFLSATITSPGTSSAVLKLAISAFSDNTTWTDWGTDYSSYIETGFDSAGDIMRNSKKAPVLISHMEITEDTFITDPNDPTGNSVILNKQSGCTLYSGWDWANTYSNGQQIYRFNRNFIPSGADTTFSYGRDLTSVRTRIRGKGHSLGLKLVADAGKDARIAGIGILFTASKEI